MATDQVMGIAPVTVIGLPFMPMSAVVIEDTVVVIITAVVFMVAIAKD
jgi:hypothetical protein